MKYILFGLISFSLMFPVFAEGLAFNILAQDEAVVKEVKSEGENVWIKLAPDYVSDSITLRISNQNQDSYRTWFNNERDLVSSGYRGKNVWSDRVQTKARYIEYWHNNVLVLHLERK
ncbi:MAG: hypothetical protein ACYST9_03420 [Planctomycetota bacterium]|jgi:hypothetical protein